MSTSETESTSTEGGVRLNKVESTYAPFLAVQVGYGEAIVLTFCPPLNWLESRFGITANIGFIQPGYGLLQIQLSV